MYLQVKLWHLKIVSEYYFKKSESRQIYERVSSRRNTNVKMVETLGDRQQGHRGSSDPSSFVYIRRFLELNAFYCLFKHSFLVYKKKITESF